MAQQSRLIWNLRETYRTCYWTARGLRDRAQRAYDRFISCAWKLPEITVQDLCGMVPDISLENIIREWCCLPPYHGVFAHNDIGPLLQIVAHRQPRVILELGTAHGNTVANVCRACDARVYTVNALPEQISGQYTTFTLERDDIGSVYRNYGLSDRVFQIYADTKMLKLREHLAPSTLDLVIIDACHDQDYVISDFLKVIPFVRCGGLVMLHDTDPSMKDHLYGSYMACIRLRQAGFDIRHLSGTWWGIWRK